MTTALGPPPVVPGGTRASQTGAPAAPVPGFLSVNGERIESTNALVDRLGTPGLKGAPRGAAAAGLRAATRRERRADPSGACFAPLLTAVVEAYSESWGPCGSVAPLMRKFMLEVAPPAKALQVLVVRPACGARRRVHEGLQGRRGASPAPALSCRVPRAAQCKAEGNTLLEKFRSTSVPHFLFFRDGHLRDTVVGPNIPALDRVLRQHIPKPEDPVVDPTVRFDAVFFKNTRGFSAFVFALH